MSLGARGERDRFGGPRNNHQTGRRAEGGGAASQTRRIGSVGRGSGSDAAAYCLSVANNPTGT